MVASSLPPSPASTAADLDPGRGQGDEGGGGRDLELGHRLTLVQGAVDDLGRLGGPLDRGGEGDRVDLPPPISTRSDQRAGAARGRRRREPRAPRAGPRHPRHRGLAVGADDVDRGEAVLGHPQRGGQQVHPLEARASSRSARASRGRPRPPLPSSSAGQLLELGAVALQLRALLLDDLRRRLGDEALVGELALGAPRPRTRSSARRSSIRAATAAASSSSPSEHLDRADRGDRVRAVASTTLEARQPPDELGRPPAATMRRSRLATGTPTRSRQARSRRVSSIAASTSASAPSSSSDSSASGKAATTRSPSRARVIAPDLLGDERHHRMGQRRAPRRARRGASRRPPARRS